MAYSLSIHDLTSILSTGKIPGGAEAYLGRITSIEKEGSQQFVLLQSELGRLRLPVEGDLSEGDLLRMIFVNGTVRFEKQNANIPPTLTHLVTPNLPPDLSMPRELAQFEAELFKFLFQATDATHTNTEKPSVATTQSTANLPTLILQVLQKKNGLEFLTQQIRTANPELLRTLTQALAQWTPKAEAKDQSEWAAALNGFRRALTLAENSLGTAPATGEPLAKELMRYLRPSPGSDLYLGRGVVQERLPSNTGLPEMARYRIDLGGALLDVTSPDIKNPGNFGVFGLQREQGRLVARFRNPEMDLPSQLHASFNTADASGKASLLVAADFLRTLSQDPEFVPATVDFARLLSDTGRLQGPKATLPSPDELENLFRMLLAYPRDETEPQLQAKVWDESVRNPNAFKTFINLLRPENDAQVLNSETQLKVDESPLSVDHKSSPGREALSHALRAAMGDEGNPWNSLIDLAKDASGGIKLPGAEKFLLQAMLGLGSERQETPQGGSQQLYFFHANEWLPAKVQWNKFSKQNSGADGGGEKPPMQIKIATQTQHLGLVEVDLTLDAHRSKLDFRNEKNNVRDLLSQSLPPLERLLDGMGFHLASWFYSQSVSSQEKKRPTERIELPLPPPIPSGPASMLDVFG